MTEITEIAEKLPETVQEFVLRWGDMGGQWGVNRSVAQIHALLFMSERPMHAEEISQILGIARSNVSNSIKELFAWRLIEKAPINHDRRDHFVAVEDVMTMFRLIVRGRMEREINPAIDTLTRCLARAESDKALSVTGKTKLEEMNTFVTGANEFYRQMQEVPNSKLFAMMKMGSSILKFLPGMKGG